MEQMMTKTMEQKAGADLVKLEQSFNRLPRESSKAYAMFRAYLAMGPERSHARVAEQFKVTRRMVDKLGRKFGWQDRLVARDKYMAEVERQAIGAVAKENAVEWWKLHEAIRRQAWKAAEEAIAMVSEARQRWEDSGRTVGFEGMARMLDLAFKLKQFAAGMPTEIKEVHNLHAGKVSIEWEEAIKRAYAVVEPSAPAVLDVQEVKP